MKFLKSFYTLSFVIVSVIIFLGPKIARPETSRLESAGLILYNRRLPEGLPTPPLPKWSDRGFLLSSASPCDTNVPYDAYHNNDVRNSSFSLWVIRLYQRYISPVDGSRCPMYPSCSQFAIQAIKQRGTMGIVMTFDRLLRCGRDLGDYPLTFKDGRTLSYDPVMHRSDCAIGIYAQQFQN